MRLYTNHATTKLAVLRALVAMPERARAVALASTIIGVGETVNGMALPAGELNGDPLIVLAERGAETRDTCLHEVAHLYLAHREGGEQSEREAATLARGWGAVGGSGDVELHVSHAREFIASAPNVKTSMLDGQLTFTCPCGSVCETFCPTVVGMAAWVGFTCSRCAWCEVVDVGALMSCPDHPGHASATWTDRATPTFPELSLVCAECGPMINVRVRTDPASEPESVERPPRAVDRAARQLSGIEAALRRLDAQAGDVSDALEATRGTLVWVRGLLVRTMRDLDAHDPRRQTLIDADVELARAGERLARRDLSGAADHVARASAALDALPTTRGGVERGGVA